MIERKTRYGACETSSKISVEMRLPRIGASMSRRGQWTGSLRRKGDWRWERPSNYAMLWNSSPLHCESTLHFANPALPLLVQQKRVFLGSWQIHLEVSCLVVAIIENRNYKETCILECFAFQAAVASDKAYIRKLEARLSGMKSTSDLQSRCSFYKTRVSGITHRSILPVTKGGRIQSSVTMHKFDRYRH